MASLIHDSNGTSRVLFSLRGKRQTLRLGKMDRHSARAIKARVELLITAARTNMPIDASTSLWVDGLTDDMADKLARVELVPLRNSLTIGGFIEAFRARRAAKAKPASMIAYRTLTNDLLEYFKADMPLRSITVEDAENYEAWMQSRNKGLSPYTVARRITAVKSIFTEAVRLEYIARNPFAKFRARYIVNEDRKAYISLEDTRRIIDQCRSDWKLIVALSRYAGLRCPSEVLSLKWESVNLPAGRMVVHSPKTEHLPGKASRVVPIFPLLKPILEDAFELAEKGAVYVVPGEHRHRSHDDNHGWKNANLRTTMRKIINRAGVKPYPRLFHNLRASCETDLLSNHPIHVVTAWIGNTPAVALKHYAQVLDTDFEAAQNTAHSDTLTATTHPKSSSPTLTNQGEVQNSLESKGISWTLRGSNPQHEIGGFDYIFDEAAQNTAHSSDALEDPIIYAAPVTDPRQLRRRGAKARLRRTGR